MGRAPHGPMVMRMNGLYMTPLEREGFAEHYERLIRELDRPPIPSGRSFGEPDRAPGYR